MIQIKTFLHCTECGCYDYHDPECVAVIPNDDETVDFKMVLPIPHITWEPLQFVKDNLNYVLSKIDEWEKQK